MISKAYLSICSAKELLLLEHLQGYHHNLFIVGDADQAIYGFKGGDVKLFIDFPDNFTPCEKIKLEQNYRSVAEVVQIGNELIENNVLRDQKVLKAERGVSQNKVKHYHAKSDEEEMKFVADEIQRLVKESAYSYKDIAIIYRSKNSKKSIEGALVREAIPYTILGEKTFYQLKEIKTVIAYLKMLENVHDNEAFLLTVNEPARKFGEERQNRLKMYAEVHELSYYDALMEMLDNGSFSRTESSVALYIEVMELLRAKKHSRVSELLDEVLNKSSYLRKLKTQAKEAPYENVMNLVEGVKELERRLDDELTLPKYLDIVKDLSKDANERYTDEEVNNKEFSENLLDQVNLMTIHVSKGLEYPVVFIIHFNDEILPNGRNLNGSALEEERRLAYVALTRAKDLLYVTESEGSSEDSDKEMNGKLPSRFLYEVNRQQFEVIKPIPKSIEDSIKAVAKGGGAVEMKTIFEVGTRVQHTLNKKYGSIVQIEEKAYVVNFDGNADLQRINRQVDCLKIVEQSNAHVNDKKLASLLEKSAIEENKIEEPPSENYGTVSLTKNEPYSVQLSLLNQGVIEESIFVNKVGRHAIFGKATIVGEDEVSYTIWFDEIKEQRKIDKSLNCIMFD